MHEIFRAAYRVRNMATKGRDSDPGSPFSIHTGEDPELSVERLMTELVDQASVIIAAQQRLRRLLASNRSIVQELSLPAVL